MRILMVSNIFPPGFIGGYELGAYDVLRDLVKRGHKVKVLTSDYFEDEYGELTDFDVDRSLENVHLCHEVIDSQTKTRGWFYFNYKNIRKLGSLLRSFKPDVVLLFNVAGLGVLSIIQFLEKIKVPTVLYLMDNPFREMDTDSPAYKHYLSIFGELRFPETIKIVSMSRSLINEVFENLGFTVSDVAFIPGWIDAIYNPVKLASHDDNREVRFVFSSNVAPHKGTEILIEAAELLVSQGINSFTIDVYGSGWVAQFLNGVRMKGLDNYIRYCGCKPKHEMLQLFSQYDALLFPTWEREPFGFVVSEAASAGCFPIMTAGIGASEWFRDGVDCFMIQRNPEALMKAMLRMITMTSDERKQLRATAMQSARASFDSAKWMTEIEQLCVEMQQKSQVKNFSISRQVQSAFLFLGEMWREALEIEMIPMKHQLPTKNIANSFNFELETKNPFENLLWKYGMRHAKVVKKIPLISQIAEKCYFKLIGKR